MNLLIISATKLEISRILDQFTLDKNHENIYSFQYNSIKIDFLITGVGIANTTYVLTRQLLTQKYDFALNLGIGGSFNYSIPIGTVCRVNTDEFGDLGLENENNFTTIFEAGFADAEKFPFQNGKLHENGTLDLSLLPETLKVSAITVNTAHTNENSIKKLTSKFNVDLETMEGAAVFMVCLQQKIPCLQIRAVSNYVSPRHTAQWDIKLAIERLCQFGEIFIHNFEKIHNSFTFTP